MKHEANEVLELVVTGKQLQTRPVTCVEDEGWACIGPHNAIALVASGEWKHWQWRIAPDMVRIGSRAVPRAMSLQPDDARTVVHIPSPLGIHGVIWATMPKELREDLLKAGWVYEKKGDAHNVQVALSAYMMEIQNTQQWVPK